MITLLHFAPLIAAVLMFIVWPKEKPDGDCQQERFYATGEDYRDVEGRVSQADRAALDDCGDTVAG